MRRIRIIVTCLGLLLILSGVFTTPAQAYLWSNQANLSITVSPSGIMMIDAINCKSATLSGNGKYYIATVSNPWLSNKCVFKVSNAYVGNGVSYVLTFKYTNYFMQFSKSASVYVKRPLGATYSTTISYKP